MYQFKGLEDTIIAIATPAGQGGIGIVRLSGKNAIVIADQFLRLKTGVRLTESKTYSLHYGWAFRSEQIIDEVLVSLMRGPKSYTAEDVVEISCHGGSVVLRAVLEIALSSGARLAEPGEFTKRAFLNGRIDLTQAEAVMDIIHAKTETFLRVSHHQLKGELSQTLEGMREELIALYTTVEAIINFPEDGIDTQSRRQIQARIQVQEQLVAKLLKTSNQGRILKEGIRIVLCGKPNVGKSSLLNVLLKQQRAIVTPIAGTTRDVLEESTQIKGIPLHLVDTAGILEPRDLVEEEAIKRSHLSINTADLILLVLDQSSPLEEQDKILVEQIKSRAVIVVLNKIDLPSRMNLNELPFEASSIVKVSAVQGSAVEELESKIVESVWQSKDIDPQGIFLNNLRHVRALEDARNHLVEASGLIDKQTSWEFISEELKLAVNDMDAITGRNIDEDLLNRIFSEFCIGK